jgi:hypothetical protein
MPQQLVLHRWGSDPGSEELHVVPQHSGEFARETPHAPRPLTSLLAESALSLDLGRAERHVARALASSSSLEPDADLEPEPEHEPEDAQGACERVHAPVAACSLRPDVRVDMHQSLSPTELPNLRRRGSLSPQLPVIREVSVAFAAAAAPALTSARV